jgi:hypothetical protein
MRTARGDARGPCLGIDSVIPDRLKYKKFSR